MAYAHHTNHIVLIISHHGTFSIRPLLRQCWLDGRLVEVMPAAKRAPLVTTDMPCRNLRSPPYVACCEHSRSSFLFVWPFGRPLLRSYRYLIGSRHQPACVPVCAIRYYLLPSCGKTQTTIITGRKCESKSAAPLCVSTSASRRLNHLRAALFVKDIARADVRYNIDSTAHSFGGCRRGFDGCLARF